MEKTILKTDNVQKYYGNKGVVTKAIDNISFEIGAPAIPLALDGGLR